MVLVLITRNKIYRVQITKIKKLFNYRKVAETFVSLSFRNVTDTLKTSKLNVVVLGNIIIN